MHTWYQQKREVLSELLSPGRFNQAACPSVQTRGIDGSQRVTLVELTAILALATRGLNLPPALKVGTFHLQTYLTTHCPKLQLPRSTEHGKRMSMGKLEVQGSSGYQLPEGHPRASLFPAHGNLAFIRENGDLYRKSTYRWKAGSPSCHCWTTEDTPSLLFIHSRKNIKKIKSNICQETHLELVST